MTEGMKFEVREGIGTITLDRPDRLNSLTFEVYQRLVDLFRELESDDTVKVVIITGTGRGFCSGGDVHDIIGRLVSYGPTDMTAFARMTGDVIRNMRRLRKPIIAALNGTAAGAGAVIALGHNLGLEVVAEGIESEPQLNALHQDGCDVGQGFYLGRPVDHFSPASVC